MISWFEFVIPGENWKILLKYLEEIAKFPDTENPEIKLKTGNIYVRKPKSVELSNVSSESYVKVGIQMTDTIETYQHLIDNIVGALKDAGVSDEKKILEELEKVRKQLADNQQELRGGNNAGTLPINIINLHAYKSNTPNDSFDGEKYPGQANLEIGYLYNHEGEKFSTALEAIDIAEYTITHKVIPTDKEEEGFKYIYEGIRYYKNYHLNTIQKIPYSIYSNLFRSKYRKYQKPEYLAYYYGHHGGYDQIRIKEKEQGFEVYWEEKSGNKNFFDSYTARQYSNGIKGDNSWNPLNFDETFNSEWKTHVSWTAQLKSQLVTAPIFLRDSVGSSIVLIDGSVFNEDTILSSLKSKPAQSKSVIHQLEAIHAAWYKKTRFIPRNTYVLKSPRRYWKVNGEKEPKKENINEFSRYETTLKNILNISEGQLVILDFDYNSLKKEYYYYDYIREDRFFDILMEYRNKCQIIITCHRPEIECVGEDDDEGETYPYDTMLEQLQKHNVPVNPVAERINDASLWDIDSFKKFLEHLLKENPAALKQIGNPAACLWEWKSKKRMPLDEFLLSRMYRMHEQKFIKEASNKLEQSEINDYEKKSLKLLTDAFQFDPENKDEYVWITTDWEKEINKFAGRGEGVPVLQPELAYYLNILDSRGTDLGTKRHICICGNTGSGKSTAAKLLGGYMHMIGIVPELYKVVQASSFIGQFQVQTSPKVAKAFEDAHGRVMIIEGIDSLLSQNDYGDQALDEIGYQMENCDRNTVIILTGEENSLQKIFAKIPNIGTGIGHTIHLRDYNKAELEQFIEQKLAKWNVALQSKNDSAEVITAAAVTAAFDKLQEEYLKSESTSTQGLKFNLTSNVSFTNVIGNERGKNELCEIAKHIGKNDGYILPKGILLEGAPGTGKTLLAKAFANEAKVPFCSVPVSYFTEPRADSAERVQTLFNEAKKRGNCVIFIDEIESLVPSREMLGHSTPLMSQLLTEMDGFADNNGIIILAATNHAELIDSAILRPGRFDRIIHISSPDTDTLTSLFEYYINKSTGCLKEECANTEITVPEKDTAAEYKERLQSYIRLIAGGDISGETTSIGLLLKNGYFAEDVANALYENYCLNEKGLLNASDSSQETTKIPQIQWSCEDGLLDKLPELAKEALGCSSSAVKAVVDKAINLAAGSGESPLCLKECHLRKAITDIIDTTVLDKPLSYEECERTAYHEIGHAIIALCLAKKQKDGNYENPISKISIIPHEGYLGVTITSGDPTHVTKAYLQDKIKHLLGGRAMEELIYGEENVSCGCYADMKQAGNIILEMLTTFGFNKNVGLLPFKYDTATESAKATVLAEGNKLLEKLYESVMEMLSKYSAKIREFVSELIKRHEISGNEFYEYWNPIIHND